MIVMDPSVRSSKLGIVSSLVLDVYFQVVMFIPPLVCCQLACPGLVSDFFGFPLRAVNCVSKSGRFPWQPLEYSLILLGSPWWQDSQGRGSDGHVCIKLVARAV